MSVITDIEMQLKAAMYEDKEVTLRKAQNALANIAALAYNYQLHPKLHAEALQSISDVANNALRSIV